MSFFEDIATALDSEGIESRVHDGTLFVPITSDLELRFIEIDSLLPAANVYTAVASPGAYMSEASDDAASSAEEYSEEPDDEGTLISVVFSVDDAVAKVSSYIAIDQTVTLLHDLLDSTDERIEDLEFFHDEYDPHVVFAEVGMRSELRVTVVESPENPHATVEFLTFPVSYEDTFELAERMIAHSHDAEVDDEETEYEHEDFSLRGDDELFQSTVDYLESVQREQAEILDLGSFEDFDRLFDVLALAAEQAESWEAQITPLEEEPDIYDIFVEDSAEEYDEEDYDDDIDDESDDPEEEKEKD